MSNPNQEIIESRLASYVDGELEDAGERLEIEQHLQQNPQYRRLLDDLRKQRDMLRVLPREAAPADLADALNGQLERSVLLDSRPLDGDGPRMRIFALPRIVAAAAIVLLTVSLAAIVYFVLPSRNARTVSLAPVNPVAVAPPPAGGDMPAPGEMPPPAASEMPAPGDKSAAETAAIARANPVDAPAVPAAAPPPVSVAAMDDRAAANPQRAQEKTVDTQGELRFQVSAKRLALSRPEAISPPAQPRDAELDELAKNLSHEPQIRNILSAAPGSNVRAAAAPATSNDAVVVVVRAGDVRRVQQRLDQFFADSKIQWQPAAKTVELALNTSLSQKTGEALENGPIANAREIDPKAIEIAGEVEQQNKKMIAADAAGARNATPIATGAAVPTPTPSAAPMAAARPGIADGSPQGTMTEERAKSDVADALVGGTSTFAAPIASPSMDAAVAPSHATFAANATPINNLYVARRLSRRQARELTDFLARTGDVRQASVALPPNELRFAGNSPATSADALAHNFDKDAVPSTPIAQARQPAHGGAVGGGVAVGGGAVGGGGGGRGAANGPLSSVPASNGQIALRNSTEAAGANRQDRQVAAQDGTADKPDAALEQRDQAIMSAPRDERRSGGEAPAAPRAAFQVVPTTQPAPAADDDSAMVDLVIVLQKDSASSPGLIAAPATQPAAWPTVTASPAALLASPAPAAATQPSTPIPPAKPVLGK